MTTSCSSNILVIMIIRIKDFYFIYYQNKTNTDGLQILSWSRIVTAEYSIKPNVSDYCIT